MSEKRVAARGLYDHATKLLVGGDPVGAIPILRACLEKDPGHVAGLCDLGSCLFQCGLGGEAVELTERALELNPDMYEAVNNLGMMKQSRGDIEGAEECFNRAIELKPERQTAQNNKAMNSLYSDKDHQEIFDIHKEVGLALASNVTDFNVGETYLVTDRTDGNPDGSYLGKTFCVKAIQYPYMVGRVGENPYNSTLSILQFNFEPCSAEYVEAMGENYA